MVIENLLGCLYIILFKTIADEVDTIIATPQIRKLKHTEVKQCV